MVKYRALLVTAGLFTYPALACHAQESLVPDAPVQTATVFSQPVNFAFATSETLPAFKSPAAPVEAAETSASAMNPLGFFTSTEPRQHSDEKGSTYTPVDSWIYPEVTRLYSMGYVSSTFLGMRPWTRRSLLHILQDSQ